MVEDEYKLDQATHPNVVADPGSGSGQMTCRRTA